MSQKTNCKNQKNLAVFAKNLNKEKVRIRLFIEKGKDKFEKLSLKAKMTQIIKLEDRDMMKWY